MANLPLSLWKMAAFIKTLSASIPSSSAKLSKKSTNASAPASCSTPSCSPATTLSCTSSRKLPKCAAAKPTSPRLTPSANISSWTTCPAKPNKSTNLSFQQSSFSLFLLAIPLSTHLANLRYELCSPSSPRRDKNERLLDRSFIGVVFSPWFLFRDSARREGYARRAVSSLVQSQKIQPAETDQSRPKIGKRSARLQWRPGSKTDASVASSGNLAARQKLAGCLLVV